MAKNFTLPKGWYRLAASEAIAELEKTLGRLTATNAWLFLYLCVAWLDDVPKGSGAWYLHINDRLKSKAGKTQAQSAEKCLKSFLPESASVAQLINQIGRRYEAERQKQGGSDWERNNVTGSGLEATLQVLIDRLSGILPSRTPNLNTLQGFELAPPGYHSKPDLALFSARDFRLLISTKWTLRKERIGTYLHEAYFYKRRRPDLQVAFVVADFNDNILRWLVNDELVDRVYHVALPLVLEVHKPWQDTNSDLGKTFSLLMKPGSKVASDYVAFLELSTKIFPLEQLFRDIETLKPKDSENLADPETEDESSEDDEERED